MILSFREEQSEIDVPGGFYVLFGSGEFVLTQIAFVCHAILLLGFPLYHERNIYVLMPSMLI